MISTTVIPVPRALILQPPLLLAEHFIDYPYFAGTGAYLAAAVLREQGWEVSVLDGFTAPGADLTKRDALAWLGEGEPRYLERLSDLRADLALINASPFLLAPPARPWLEKLLCAIPRPAVDLVVMAEMFCGGMHYLETDPERWLNDLPGLDLVLRYECEPLLERLASEISAGCRPERGVWENHNAFSLDDALPPAFDLLDAEAFFAFLKRVLASGWRPGPFSPLPERTLPLVTSRGCPYGCIFCSKNPGLPGERRQVRAIPLFRIERWVTDWIDRFDLERLVVLDELVNPSPERFDALLDLVERKRLRLQLPNGLRADRLTERQIERLSALCDGIKVSLESASPRVQNEILHKNLDPAAVERVAAWCDKHGLALGIHYLIGIPGEQRREIRSTLQTAIRLHRDLGARPYLQFATPLPGTRLQQICEEQELLEGRTDDPYGAFQHRGVIRTDAFDPHLLRQAFELLERGTAPAAAAVRKLIVNLTYQCNNRCIFCAVGDRPARHADAQAVRAALQRYRDEGYRLLDLDGGEPTLHPELFSIIAGSVKLGFARIALITNGRRASYPPFARELANSGLHEILVSLHAPDADLQARLTSVPEAFEQTTAGIRNLLAALPSPAQLAVNTTLVAKNLPTLPDLAALLSRLGVQRWNLQVVTPFGRARSDQVPAETDLQKHLGDLLAHPPPDSLRIQVINCPPCLLPGHEQAAGVDFAKAERDMVFVGAEGENLQAFLSRKRRHTPRCYDCIHALVCPGEYAFES